MDGRKEDDTLGGCSLIPKITIRTVVTGGSPPLQAARQRWDPSWSFMGSAVPGPRGAAGPPHPPVFHSWLQLPQGRSMVKELKR